MGGPHFVTGPVHVGHLTFCDVMPKEVLGAPIANSSALTALCIAKYYLTPNSC